MAIIRGPRLVSWIALIVALIGLLAYGTLDQPAARTKGELAAELSTKYACPTCDGQSVAESQAPVAQNIRQELIRLVDEGRDEAEIEATLVARYGEAVLLTPSATGLVGLVWLLPVLGLVAACAGLWLVFRRWQRAGPDAVTEDDHSLVASALRQRRGRS